MSSLSDGGLERFSTPCAERVHMVGERKSRFYRYPALDVCAVGLVMGRMSRFQQDERNARIVHMHGAAKIAGGWFAR